MTQMNLKWVSSSPHIRSAVTTRSIMLDVIIALLPAAALGVFFFGSSAFLTIALSIACCVGFEYLFNLVLKKKQTIGDLSAVVTGLLWAFCLPPTIPAYITVLGSFIAIVIIKGFFGGIGRNFANPAIAARIFLFISFAGPMTNFVAPFSYRASDVVSAATPLVSDGLSDQWQLFLGLKSGCIGEVSILALLIGGVYLIARRIIHPVTPLCYIGTVFVMTFLLGQDPVESILVGAVVLVGFFMATDYSTTPVTTVGRIIFAVGCGMLTVIIRVYGAYPDGASFGILIMNILTPLIDRIKTKPFGTKGRGKA